MHGFLKKAKGKVRHADWVEVLLGIYGYIIPAFRLQASSLLRQPNLQSKTIS